MAAPDGCSSSKDYRERLVSFKDTDANKYEMIIDLIENLEIARDEYRQTDLDLKSEKEGRRRLQARVEELEGLTRTQNSHAFVLVLLDADADDYIFRERFLDKGEEGGKEAADELNDRIVDYLRTTNVDLLNIKIMVRAYADVKSLQSHCVRSGKMKSSTSLNLFVHGINQRQALFDFVDVGSRKEGADNKVRECLDFFVESWQCKHIILGACHDSGYASFLGKHAASSATRDRITLLQGATMHPSIASLGFNRTLRLDTVFAQPGATSAQANASSTSSPAPGPTSSNDNRPHLVNPSPLSHRLGPARYNEVGQRVDRVLDIDIGSPYLNVLRIHKLCPWYYLRGKCDGECNKNHIPQPLNAREFDCLWYISRSGLCYKIRKGKICEDAQCIYGHEEGCPIGTGGTGRV